MDRNWDKIREDASMDKSCRTLGEETIIPPYGGIPKDMGYISEDWAKPYLPKDLS